MNSWEIIKSELTKKSRPGTLGHSIAVNQGAELYVRLMHKLSDREAATAAMNKDQDVGEAILARPAIKELQEAGVLS